MAVKYSLLDNPLTPDPHDFRALVQDSVILREIDLIEDMISRGSTTTKVDVLAVLEQYKAALRRALAAGKRINTDLLNISTSIQGVFTGAEDRFDSARHTVRINVSAGTLLREIEQSVKLQKVPPPARGPALERFEDVVSHTANDNVTAGGTARLTGYNLKIRADVTGSGLFFVEAGGAEHAVETYIRNTPKELIFMIPPLPTGRYTIEVRSAIHRSTVLRTGRLGAALTVKGSESRAG